MPHGYMRHPPVRRVPWVTSKKRLEDMSWDVHDLGAHSEEDLGGLVLREEVRDYRALVGRRAQVCEDVDLEEMHPGFAQAARVAKLS